MCGNAETAQPTHIVDDIRRVARTYLHPDNARIVAAGRGSLLQNTLARFGTVDVFHADGHPLPTHDIKGD